MEVDVGILHRDIADIDDLGFCCIRDVVISCVLVIVVADIVLILIGGQDALQVLVRLGLCRCQSRILPHALHREGLVVLERELCHAEELVLVGKAVGKAEHVHEIIGGIPDQLRLKRHVVNLRKCGEDCPSLCVLFLLHTILEEGIRADVVGKAVIRIEGIVGCALRIDIHNGEAGVSG